jgi:hypothetical protein
LQVAETHVKNEHEITDRDRKPRELKSYGHISDYLVKLKDINCKVEFPEQVFRDQVKFKMLLKIVYMMYMISPSPREDEEF